MVPFTDKNMGRDPEARKELISLGVTTLPVLIIGDRKLSGFNPAQIDAPLTALDPPIA